MRDFVEYLQAYRAYISANLGWGKMLRFALVWLAGMFVPLAAKTFLKLPNCAVGAYVVKSSSDSTRSAYPGRPCVGC